MHSSFKGCASRDSQSAGVGHVSLEARSGKLGLVFLPLRRSPSELGAVDQRTALSAPFLSYVMISCGAIRIHQVITLPVAQ